MERDPETLYDETDWEDFNSHAHVERDPERLHLRLTNKISTHTLTWSVTITFVNSKYKILFQLTRSRGA